MTSIPNPINTFKCSICQREFKPTAKGKLPKHFFCYLEQQRDLYADLKGVPLQERIRRHAAFHAEPKPDIKPAESIPVLEPTPEMVADFLARATLNPEEKP